MARGCTESDSEEERHDRFRSERNSGSLNASKSLFSTGLQPSNKARSPPRRINSPSRRDRRSPSARSRSHSKRRSKDRKLSKEERGSKEKSRKDIEKPCSRSSSKVKDSRYSDEIRSSRSETSRSRHRRSGSKERKRKSKDLEKNHSESVDRSSDTFLQRFERRRPSVEYETNEEGETIYRALSPELEDYTPRISQVNKLHKKDKKKKKGSVVDPEEGELISEEENNCFGPALPPKYESEEDNGELGNSNSAVGPTLPPGFNNRSSSESALSDRLCSRKRSSSDEERPIKFQRLSKSDTEEDGDNKAVPQQRLPLIGPVLPPRENLPTAEDQDEETYGPALPPPSLQHFTDGLAPENTMEVDADLDHKEDGDDPMIGPLPKGLDTEDGVQKMLEARAQTLRKQLENKDTDADTADRNRRENWMVELPDIKTTAHLGLGPRKFRTREGPDTSDRSSWTDIAGVKQEKNDTNSSNDEDSRRLEISARDAAMELKAKESSKNREKSLLELHQKEMKKKKKKELEISGGKEERRPFSREIDLQVNRFDESKTRSVIKKAQFLDSRFSSGESKFL